MHAMSVPVLLLLTALALPAYQGHAAALPLASILLKENIRLLSELLGTEVGLVHVAQPSPRWEGPLVSPGWVRAALSQRAALGERRSGRACGSQRSRGDRAGRTDGRMDRWMDRRMGGRTGVCLHVRVRMDPPASSRLSFVS